MLVLAAVANTEPRLVAQVVLNEILAANQTTTSNDGSFPDDPNAGFVPYEQVEAFNYSTQSSWPTVPSGLSALSRVSSGLAMNPRCARFLSAFVAMIAWIPTGAAEPWETVGQGGQIIAGHEAAPASPAAGSKFITLRDCLFTALLGNRDLQVERLNPEIARASLSLTYGAYDPLFLAEARKEHSSDSGGFDPSDFSRDAIYDAESDIVRAGLTGLLPGGLTYTLDAGYANSYGTRNFLNFDSHKVSAGFLLRQPLLRNLWIDEPRFAIRVARHDLSISELVLSFMTMDVIHRVQITYVELAQARRQFEVQTQLVETRRRLLMASNVSSSRASPHSPIGNSHRPASPAQKPPSPMR
jgi:hypothetical protein